MSSFRPWLKPGLLAAACAASGLIAIAIGLFLAGRNASPDAVSLGAVAVGALLLMMAVPIARRAWARFYGQWVEARARREVRKKVARGWHVEEFAMGVAGDVDLVLQSPDRSERYIIEIKSQQAVQVERSLGIFGKHRIRTQRSSPGRDPLEQARTNAMVLQGSAVLWYPKARVCELHQLEGALVVLGPASYLLKALNAKRGWFS